MSNPRREASERLGGGYEVRVLEPSPPSVNEAPWYADDPAARGEVPPGLRLVGPTSAADITWDDISKDDRDLASWCEDRWLVSNRRLESPPPAFETTRRHLHVLAEHVLAVARHRSNGKIGLRYTHGGFGTPFFADTEQVRVVGTSIVHESNGDERQTEIATVLDAADALGLPCGAPADVYAPTTKFEPEAKLDVDPGSSSYLSDLFGFATHVLEEFRARTATEERASRVQLWPEHFDVAVEIGDEALDRRAGYGVSPGDDDHSEPYLYVVPWAGCPDDSWWNATYFNGARCDLHELVKAPDQRELALGFFEESRRRLLETVPEKGSD